MTELTLDDFAKIFAKLDRSNGPKSCWIWNGCRTSHHYGNVRIRGKNYRVHGIIAHFMIGQNPLNVCHHCDNPPCCNPSHLFYGTQSENLKDMSRKGRSFAQIRPEQRQGIKNGRHLLTVAQVLEIKRRQGDRICNLAKEFKVNWTTIWNIRKGNTWTQIMDEDCNEVRAYD